MKVSLALPLDSGNLRTSASWARDHESAKQPMELQQQEKGPNFFREQRRYESLLLGRIFETKSRGTICGSLRGLYSPSW